MYLTQSGCTSSSTAHTCPHSTPALPDHGLTNLPTSPAGRSQAHPQPIRISELRRQSLLDALGLSQTQLQQLAGILGNDHIKHIAKDKITALKAAHPNEHPVAVLAKQVLELQPQLADLSPAAAAAAAATAAAKEAAAARERERALIDPVVRQVVAAAVASVCGKAAEAAAAAAAARGSKKGKGAAAGGAAAEAIAPEVKQLVATAVSRAVAAADEDAGGFDDEDEHHDELEDGHHEDDEQGHEDDAAAAAGAAANGGSAAAAANPTDMLVDRCRRSLLQYGPCDVKPPVQVGSGDRWLLQHKGILMRGVGLEDMSKTPSHVLLQPLRLSVYASMGLSSVTEYLCVPDEKWKEWAAGRAVSVPAQPSAGGKKSGKPRRSKDKGAIDPAVKKLVAAMFANVLAANGGAPAAAAEAAAPAAAEPAAAEPAAEPAAAASATSAEESPADEPAVAAAAADGEADAGVHPAVMKLVAAAVANVVAGKVSARGGSKAYEPLPKALPNKPLELVQFIVKRLRALDPSAEQFSRKQEKLLLLQVG
jgi:hypothetical protein